MKQTMIDTTLLAGSATEAIDLSGYANSLLFSETAEEIEAACIGDLARRRIAALKDATFSFTCADDDSGDPWDTLQDLFAADGAHFGWVQSNSAMAEGDRGVMVEALETSYARGGDVGALRTIQIAGNGNGPMIYARVLQQDESLTVSGNSTGINFGALSTGETLYCKQWVLSVTAGSIVGTIESDSSGGFSSPTTQATFTSASGTTTEEQTVVGPQTDTWWRYEYTITTGPAVVLVMIGKK